MYDSLEMEVYIMSAYDLSRYTLMHQRDFETALLEIKSGKKQSHWMWYVFPQIHGLGKSSTSVYYAINSAEEAKAFLDDAYLGNNLIQICDALLEIESNNAIDIFGRTDAMKLKSSMTLFAYISGKNSVFRLVLKKFFNDTQDNKTLLLLKV